jgi:hypothetical protein
MKEGIFALSTQEQRRSIVVEPIGGGAFEFRGSGFANVFGPFGTLVGRRLKVFFVDFGRSIGSASLGVRLQ